MSTTLFELELWQTCSVFACTNPVALAGDVCGDCRSAFGEMIQQTDAPTAAEVAAPGVDPESDTRRGQTCWMCEQRRTCTRTPQGWECKACSQVR